MKSLFAEKAFLNLTAYNYDQNLLYFPDGQIKNKYRFMQNKNQIDERKMHLRDAEHNAKKLFDQTVKNNWIRSGISELSSVTRFMDWHLRCLEPKSIGISGS